MGVIIRICDQRLIPNYKWVRKVNKVTCIKCLKVEIKDTLSEIQFYNLGYLTFVQNRLNFLQKQKEYNKSFESLLK